MNATLYVPTESIELYQRSNSWRDFWNIKGFDAAGIENLLKDNTNRNSKSKIFDIWGREIKCPSKGSFYITNGENL